VIALKTYRIALYPGDGIGPEVLVDIGGTLAAGAPEEVAIQSAVHTRRGIERILRPAPPR
jgi:isocitrate/isopropylmalate dehydrogenase